MSSCGIHAVLTDGKARHDPVLLIGSRVPRVHHSDGIPVYFVTESEDGIPVRCKNDSLINLLAYPSHWPAAGNHNPELWLYAKHDYLPWDALIPCFVGGD